MERKVQDYEQKDEDRLVNKMQEMSKAETLREAQQDVNFALKEQGVSNILHINIQDPESPNKVKEIHDQEDIDNEIKKKL